MTELSVVWSSGKTPVQGCIPSVRGPKLPPMRWPGRPVDARAAQLYLRAIAPLYLRLRQAKHGVFDLRAESVYLTAFHTLARCHRGAA